MATQSLYPNVIIWIRRTPSVAKAKVCRHGVWRFDLIEKAVQPAPSWQASGFMKLCAKPPWLHILVIKCMTIFSFCVDLLLLWFWKHVEGVFYTFSTGGLWRGSKNIKCELNLETFYPSPCHFSFFPSPLRYNSLLCVLASVCFMSDLRAELQETSCGATNECNRVTL